MTDLANQQKSNGPAKGSVRAWALAGALWLTLTAAGTLWMLQYAETPGAPASVPARWPSESGIRLSAERPTLLMFVHPRCPCSRASIGELHRLVTSGRERFATQVWFVQPKGMTEEWTQTDLWHSAASIPGVEVAVDRGGHEARRFGSITSGQCVFYGPEGDLWFQGGITSARGHEGDNAGRDAVLALLEKRSRAPLETPVFGCELCEKGVPP